MNFIGFHHEMMNAPDLDKYIASNASINMANSSAAWERLTPTEKMYAYFMYQASWKGAQIVPFQKSYESPPLYLIFSGFFQDGNYKELEEAIVGKKDITEQKYKQFLSYAAAFFQYMSNYHSFGSKKFIPEISPRDFRAILEANPLYIGHNRKSQLYRRTVDHLYP